MIKKKKGKITKRNLSMSKSVEPRPLLVNSEQKYKYICEDGSAAMLMLGAEGKVIDANNALLDISGYSRDEVVGKNALDFVVSEQRKKAAAQIQAASTHGAATQFEVMFRCKDGSTRTLLLPPRQLVIEGKEQRSFLVMGVDITERLRAEQALQRQADLLLKTFNSLKAGVFVLDAEDPPVILECNRGASEIFGYEKSDMVGRSITFLHVSEENLRRFQAKLYPAIEKDEYFNLEYQMKRKDGTVFPSDHTVTQLLDERGKRTGWVSVVRNITERAKYETRLLALHTHAWQLSSAEEIGTIVKYTLDAMEFALGFEHADILLVENDSLQIKGRRGTPVAFSTQPLKGRGTTVKAANTKATLRISDTRKEPAYVDIKGYDWMGPPTALSELVVPVLIDAEVVAVLCVDSGRLDAFNDQDEKLLETLAIHVGSALERLRDKEKHTQIDATIRDLARFPYENPNPVLRLSRDGSILTANPASNVLLKEWGSKVGQVAPKFWRDLVTDVLSAGQSKNLDVESGRKSYTFLVKPIVESDCVNVYGREISERKRAEEKLRESEERFRSLFERMLDGVYRSTHEGRFIDVNSAFVRMFGYSSRQEMLDIADIKKELYFSPEERGSHILDTGQAQVQVYRMRRKDGSEIWVEDHGGYVHDEQGNIIYHEGLLRDVTERKRLEEELKQYSFHLEELVDERTQKLHESEERYRELFEACPVSLWEEDFSAVKQFLDELLQNGVSDIGVYLSNHPQDIAKCATLVKVLNMNKVTLNLYDAKSADEIIGGLGCVLTEESNRAFVDEVVALVQGKKYFEAEFENRTLRGETKNCKVICAVVPGYEHSLARVLVCIVDLTPQRKLEAELVKSQRLAAIGETSAMVGHDLRNPLQGITGALHLLKQESLTTNERDEMLRLIEGNLAYANAIVQDLSDYSAEIMLKLTDTTPKSLTKEAIQTVKIQPTISVQDLSQNHPTLRVDTGQMKRVLVNIIQNAIGAMPQGGTLTITSRLWNDTVEIILSDTGPGMPEKVMENLWRPLQTTKAKGLGLGLPICKRIVDAHGGTISVKSKAGEGTTVTIGLPIKPAGMEVKQR